MSIPKRFTDELRDRLTLSEVVGRRVRLTRAGHEYKGCCPFHNEKTPSFYVNDDKQFYHCFGCGAHGDVIGFVMEHDHLSFVEAVETLAAQAGMEVPRQSPEEIRRAKTEKSLYELMDQAARYYERERDNPQWSNAAAYLKDRGLSSEILGAFRIGYAPPEGDALRAHLHGLEFTDAQIIEAGLMRPSKRGGAPPYAFFRDRIMFPVTDRRGRVVAFGGRILPETLRYMPESGVSGNKPPKYINSSDTPLFHKGSMLFNESHARHAASEGERIIVTEGYLDVMACFEAGLRGAVAPLGTALTEEQIGTLWRLAAGSDGVPILCFDGDEAGRRAAWRATERILPMLAPDKSAEVVFLPEGEDPDTLIRTRGAQAMKKILDQAMPLDAFLWMHHCSARRLDTPEQRAGLMKTLEDNIQRIQDRQIQYYYKEAMHRRAREAFSRFRGGGPTGKSGRFAPAPIKPRAVGSANRARFEQILLAVLINHPELYENIEESVCDLVCADAGLDKLRQTLSIALSEYPGLDREALCAHLTEIGLAAEMEMVLNDSVYVHAAFARPGADFQDALDGWRDLRAGLSRAGALEGEARSAGRALAADFSSENEERLMALRAIHAAGDGKA